MRQEKCSVKDAAGRELSADAGRKEGQEGVVISKEERQMTIIDVKRTSDRLLLLLLLLWVCGVCAADALFVFSHSVRMPMKSNVWRVSRGPQVLHYRRRLREKKVVVITAVTSTEMPLGSISELFRANADPRALSRSSVADVVVLSELQ